MRIIALGHRSRVGKDTMARYFLQLLKEKCPKCVIRHRSFAEKLKEITYMLYRWAGVREPSFYKEHPQERETVLPLLNMDVVQLWIKVGQAMRAIDQDTWVNEVLATKCDWLIISDLRFPNEVDKIRLVDPNAALIKVINSRAKIRDSEADNALEGINWFNKLIENEGTHQELWEKTKELLPWLLMQST